MHPKQLTILGVGLLGGSIGLAVRAKFPDCKIVGFGHRAPSLERAKQIGAIHEFQTDPTAAVAASDLVLLCTPVGTFEQMLKKIAPAILPGCIVSDVGSTKRSVVRLGESILGPGSHFVGSHPIAGSEKRGVEFARADLLQNSLCILTPTSATNADALARIENFWQTLGMQTARLNPADHDRILADVSHLPHVLAAALVAMQDEQSLQFSGQGFMDTTRIAGGDGGLWKDILLDNSDNLRSALQRLQSQITRAVEMLDKKESAPIQKWLTDAAERRSRWLEKKLRESRGD